jgi:hypothetical protein
VVSLILLCPIIVFGFRYLLSKHRAGTLEQQPEIGRAGENKPAVPAIDARAVEPAAIPPIPNPVARKVVAVKPAAPIVDVAEPGELDEPPEDMAADDVDDPAIDKPDIAEDQQADQNDAPNEDNAKKRKREPIDPEVKKLIGRLVSAPLPSGKIEAAVKLKEMRAWAEPACEQLVDLMANNRNPDVQRAASEAIERINPALHKLVLPIAVRDGSHLEGGYQDVRTKEFIRTTTEKCFAGLYELGTDANAAYPLVWRYVVENPRSDLALKTLVEIAPDDRRVFDGLARMVRPGSNNSANRLLSFRLLIRMRDVDPKTFGKVVVEAIGSNFPDDVRFEAIKVAPTLGKDAKLAIEGLRNAKVDRNENIRAIAEKALKVIEKGKDDPPGKPLQKGERPV